jgi:hypothetical protein
MGIEPTRNSSKNTILSAEDGAKSGALEADFRPLDPALAQIVDAWPNLPEAIRKAMLALAESGL